MTAEETVDQLNGLIQVCKDGENGYHQAAENVRKFSGHDNIQRIRKTARTLCA